MRAKYDVADSPDNSKLNKEEHQFSAIAARAWEKINRWQKKAGNTAGWLESLAAHPKLPVNKSEDSQDLKFSSDSNVNKVNDRLPADGTLKNLSINSINSGLSFLERSVSTASLKSLSSSSASSSLSGTPVLSSLPPSPLSTSSRDSGNPTFYRRSISPFPANDGDGSSAFEPCANESVRCSTPRGRDSPKDFVKVSKALRQGWRWLVCRFLMREYGSASVDRLLKYCGFEVPSETTYTLQTVAQISDAKSGSNVLSSGSTSFIHDRDTHESTVRDPNSRCFGIAGRGGMHSDHGRADAIRVKACSDVFRIARSQRNDLTEIVKDAQAMAAAAGMWPPLAWIGLPGSLHQTSPKTGIPLHPVPPQSSPMSHVAGGPSEMHLGSGPASSSQFSWDKFADMLGPIISKPSGEAWWHAPQNSCSSPFDSSAVNSHGDSPVTEHSMYVVSNVEGHSYEGEFKDGKMHGYGRLKWPDGHWYQGQFDKERTCGIGIRGWPSGHWYVGEEQGGWKEGLGAMGWPGGRTYEGEFSKDLRNGFGLMRWPGGRWYLGYWKDGMQQGEGLEGGSGSVNLVYMKGGAKQSEIRMENSTSLEKGLHDLIAHDCMSDIGCVTSKGQLEDAAATSERDKILEDDSKQETISRGRRRGVNVQVRQITSSSAQEPSSRPASNCDLKIDVGNSSCCERSEQAGQATDIVAGNEIQQEQAKTSPHGREEKEVDVGAMLDCTRSTQITEILADQDEATLGDEGLVSDLDDEYGEDSGDGSSSDSVDVSSGYDDSSSDENMPKAAEKKHSLLDKHHLRKSDRLVEMIQGGAIWSMLDEDDGEASPDSPAKVSRRRRRNGADSARIAGQDAADPPCRMLAEHLAAESERSLAGVSVRNQHVAASRPSQSRDLASSTASAISVHQSAGASQQLADPQLPCPQAAALSSLWCSAVAGDSAGVGRALRRISAGREGQRGRVALDVGDPADGGATALIKAARVGSVECVMHLLKARADIERRNEAGETALHAAARQGHVHVIDALASAGGEIGSLSTGGDAPLHLAAECGHVAACSALLALGADVNLPGKDGLTALQRCGSSGHAAVAKALVALGADKNSLGSTVEMGGAAGGVCGTSHALAADGQR